VCCRRDCHPTSAPAGLLQHYRHRTSLQLQGQDWPSLMRRRAQSLFSGHHRRGRSPWKSSQELL
jgi:hypothetical protein